MWEKKPVQVFDRGQEGCKPLAYQTFSIELKAMGFNLEEGCFRSPKISPPDAEE